MQTKLKKCFVVCIFILIIAVAISCTQKNENENSGAENSEKVSQEVSSSETTEIEDLLIQTDTALDVINSETLYAFSNLSLDDDGTEDDYAEVIHFSWSGEKSDSLVVVRFVLATGETLLQLYPVEENEIEVDCFPAKVIENDKEAMILQLRPGSSKESMVSILGLGISDGKKTVCEYFSSDTTPTLKRIMGTDLFEDERMNNAIITGVSGVWEAESSENGRINVVEFSYKTDKEDGKSDLFQFDMEKRKWLLIDQASSDPLDVGDNNSEVAIQAKEWDWKSFAKTTENDERYSGIMEQLNLDGIGDSDDSAEYYQIAFSDDDPWSDDVILVVYLKTGTGKSYYRIFQNKLEFFCPIRVQSGNLNGKNESIVLELKNPASNFGAESLLVLGVDENGDVQSYLSIDNESGPYILSQMLRIGYDENGNPYETSLIGNAEITDDSGLKLSYLGLTGEKKTTFYWNDSEGWVK